MATKKVYVWSGSADNPTLVAVYERSGSGLVQLKGTSGAGLSAAQRYFEKQGVQASKLNLLRKSEQVAGEIASFERPEVLKARKLALSQKASFMVPQPKPSTSAVVASINVREGKYTEAGMWINKASSELESKQNQLQTSLDSINAEYERLKNNPNLTQAQVDAYKARVEQFKTSQNQLNQEIKSFNQTVQRYNVIAKKQEFAEKAKKIIQPKQKQPSLLKEIILEKKPAPQFRPEKALETGFIGGALTSPIGLVSPPPTWPLSVPTAYAMGFVGGATEKTVYPWVYHMKIPFTDKPLIKEATLQERRQVEKLTQKFEKIFIEPAFGEKLTEEMRLKRLQTGFTPKEATARTIAFTSAITATMGIGAIGGKATQQAIKEGGLKIGSVGKTVARAEVGADLTKVESATFGAGKFQKALKVAGKIKKLKPVEFEFKSVKVSQITPSKPKTLEFIESKLRKALRIPEKPVLKPKVARTQEIGLLKIGEKEKVFELGSTQLTKPEIRVEAKLEMGGAKSLIVGRELGVSAQAVKGTGLPESVGIGKYSQKYKILDLGEKAVGKIKSSGRIEFVSGEDMKISLGFADKTLLKAKAKDVVGETFYKSISSKQVAKTLSESAVKQRAFYAGLAKALEKEAKAGVAFSLRPLPAISAGAKTVSVPKQETRLKAFPGVRQISVQRPTQKQKEKFKSVSVQLPKIVPVVSQRQKVGVKAIEKVQVKIKPVSAQIPKQVKIPSLRPISLAKVRPVQIAKTGLVQIETLKPISLQKLGLRPAGFVGLTLLGIPSLKFPRFPPLIIPGRKKKPKLEVFFEEKPEPGYNAFVKSRKRRIKVNEKPLYEISAHSLGAEVVDNTTSRSYDVKKARKPATGEMDSSWDLLKQKFYKKKGRFIEKTAFAIDSPGEFQGITVEGWIARRRKAKLRKIGVLPPLKTSKRRKK